MAYYDHGEAMKAKEDEIKYIELKNFISSPNDKGEISEWFHAYRHIVRMEHELEENKKKLKEYQNFFEMLEKLIPKSLTIY